MFILLFNIFSRKLHFTHLTIDIYLRGSSNHFFPWEVGIINLFILTPGIIQILKILTIHNRSAMPMNTYQSIKIFKLDIIILYLDRYLYNVPNSYLSKFTGYYRIKGFEILKWSY